MLSTGATAVLAPLGYGYSRFVYGYTHFGPVAAVHWSRPWYLLSLFALLAFLLLAFIRLLQAHRFIALHRKGIYCSFTPNKIFRWENIAGLAVRIHSPSFLGRSLKARYQAVLLPVTGHPLRLPSSLDNLPDLLTQIKAHLYQRLVPELQSSFDAGKWLYFGPISIHANALRLSGQRNARTPQTYAWSDVRNLSVRSGRLVVEFTDGSRRSLPVAVIPNIEILLQIIQTGVSA